jgi:hypothetical protein
MVSRLMIVLLFVYGAGLVVFCALFDGAGHGVFGPVGLAGSPFSAIGVRSSWGIDLAFAAAGLQWGLLACAGRWLRLGRGWLVGFLTVHYVTAALLLALPSSPYADWAYEMRVSGGLWLVMAAGAAWYLAGQALVWRVMLGVGRRAE